MDGVSLLDVKPKTPTVDDDKKKDKSENTADLDLLEVESEEGKRDYTKKPIRTPNT